MKKWQLNKNDYDFKDKLKEYLDIQEQYNYVLKIEMKRIKKEVDKKFNDYLNENEEMEN